MLLEGKELRILIPTNGAKMGFSGLIGGLGGGKSLKGNGTRDRHRRVSAGHIFLVWNTKSVAWEVEYTDEFEAWWNKLSEEEQAEINTRVELLEEHGPRFFVPTPT